MTVEVLTPEKKLFSGEAKGVQMPGISGSFEILNNHAPMIAALGSGLINITLENGSKTVISISSGFSECLNNQVSILVEGAQVKS